MCVPMWTCGFAGPSVAGPSPGAAPSTRLLLHAPWWVPAPTPMLSSAPISVSLQQQAHERISPILGFRVLVACRLQRSCAGTFYPAWTTVHLGELPRCVLSPPSILSSPRYGRLAQAQGSASSTAAAHQSFLHHHRHHHRINRTQVNRSWNMVLSNDFFWKRVISLRRAEFTSWSTLCSTREYELSLSADSPQIPWRHKFVLLKRVRAFRVLSSVHASAPCSI